MSDSALIYLSKAARIIRLSMLYSTTPHSSTNPVPLLVENLELLSKLEMQNGVLDLACGRGRNGLFLLQHNIPVCFADRDKKALEDLAATLSGEGKRDDKSESADSEIWLVDFESGESNPLADKCFDSILVFNYLHRPLIPAIRNAIRPGGLIFYETFTVAQTQFGRPKNPDFLLQANELPTLFSDWEIIHHFEGEMNEPQRAVANLIARRP